MCIKSTVELTRAKAEERYKDYMIKRFREMLDRQPVTLSNKDLEDKLEELNDEDYGGEGFDNYQIVD